MLNEFLTVADVNLSLGGLLYATTGEVIGSTSLHVLCLSGFYARGEGYEERSGGTCCVVQLDVGLEGGDGHSVFDETELNFVFCGIECKGVGGFAGCSLRGVAITLEQIVCSLCLVAGFVGCLEGECLCAVGFEDNGRSCGDYIAGEFYQLYLRGTVALSHIDLHARVAELHRAVSEESGITLIAKSTTSCARTHRGVSYCRAAKRISKATGIILDPMARISRAR